MRDKCDGCPCLEQKDNKPFCYWYQSSGRATKNMGCGNSFEEKPKHTQEELEEVVSEQCKTDLQKFVDNDPTLDPEMAQWIQYDIDHNPSFKKEVEDLKIRRGKK